MRDDSPSPPPEVTIEPADNGFVVRHYERAAKKDESGRSVRRVASSVDDALEHARMALGGAGKAKSSKRKPLRDGQSGSADAGDGETSPVAHTTSRARIRAITRRRARVSGRRS